MPTFTVYGHPATKGSTVSFMGEDGRIITKADCKSLAAWSQAVAWAARAERVKCTPKPFGVRLSITFMFQKPKSVKDRTHHVVRPDIDKGLRAALDSLSNGIAYDDDSQVIEIHASKCYGPETLTTITITEVPP